MRKVLMLLTCIFFALAGPLAAAEVSLGLGGGWQTSPYKGHDDTVLPIPLINIEGETFYLHGPDAGAYICKGENQAFAVGVSYGGQEFDSGDTDDARLKRLDDRDATLSAYMQYTVNSDYGNASLRILRDVLGKSDAFSAEASYKYPLYAGPITLIPGVGAVWDSEKQLEYYYGVSGHEARRSGLSEYNPNAAVSPFISLEANWQFTEKLSLMAAEKVLFLNDEIKDSPMVGDGQVFSTFVGLRYTL